MNSGINSACYANTHTNGQMMQMIFIAQRQRDIVRTKKKLWMQREKKKAMKRLIDAEDLKEDYPKDEDWEYPVNTNKYVVESIDRQPTVDAIPVAFIESEKQRVQSRIEDAVKRGMIPEAERLSGVITTLDAVVSNWIYTTGPDWRAKRREDEIN